jgi:hypothetical protein
VLLNPFTPSEIASQPEEFFGRATELDTIERALAKGSVIIEGPVGIGKSSLLARTLLLMEGFNSENRAKAVTMTGDKDVQTLDDAARCLLHEFVSVDERHNKVKFAFGSFAEFESADITQNFRDRNHLAVLKRTLEGEYLSRALGEMRVLIIAIDEADKCPVPLAQLVRSLVTHTQQKGVRGVRIVLAGVKPFFTKMLTEDQGLTRFFYKTISLEPMEFPEAEFLVRQKLELVAVDAQRKGIRLRIDPSIVGRIVALSGGHPHLIQLLGSHLIEHEEEDPDQLIDSKDLYNTLSRICYEDRSAIYDTTLHELELYNHLDSLNLLLGMSSESPPDIVSRGFPTRITDPKPEEKLNRSNCLG